MRWWAWLLQALGRRRAVASAAREVQPPTVHDWQRAAESGQTVVLIPAPEPAPNVDRNAVTPPGGIPRPRAKPPQPPPTKRSK
jgi:hypothetical protein